MPLLLLLLSRDLAGAPAAFIRLKTGPLEIVTDAGEAAGRRALLQMRRMEQLLGRKPLPLRAFLFRDERYFRELRPSPTAQGFYQSSAERDYLAVVSGPEVLRALSHEFVHASVEHTTARRPQWLEEGIAEFYSTVTLDKDKWLVGRPIPGHVGLLSQSDWLPAAELFAIGKESQIYNEANRVGIFYAQSWAVAHLLYTAPGYREQMPAFAGLLDRGVSAEEAMRSAFRKDGRQIMNDARRHILERRFPVAALAADGVSEDEVTVDQLGEEAIAELALACGKSGYAARLYRGKGDDSAMGLLALAQGDRVEALRRFEAAVRKGVPEATPYFEAAMLRKEAGQEFEPLLRQVVARAPQHAEAWFLLGLQAARRENWEDAVDAYQQATRVMPRQANFWHAMAMALVQSGRAAEARQAALQCRLAASNEPERQMAAALADLVAGGTPAAPARKPAVTIPDAWNGPREDATGEGILEELTCSEPATMRVAGIGELRILRPSEVRITGGTATLECGVQKRRVRVGFISATRELVSIEFLR